MLRILILDDKQDFGDTLARSLRRRKALEIEATAVTQVEAAFKLVQSASEPFDLFLIDQRLGPGPDGITVMQELRRLSPETSSIIFTGLNERETGLRAYQAGAYSYLPKNFDLEELIWILQAFQQSRNVQRERELLKTLNDIAGQALRALSIQEVADVITQGSKLLGFERARLWLLQEDKTTLVGASEAGHQGLDDFVGLSMPVAESLYAQYVLRHRKPVRLSREVFGPGYLDRVRRTQGFEPPRGELMYVPLWAGDRCWGILTLDNLVQRLTIHPDQEYLLELFGHHATAALERADLYERAMRKSQELEVLDKIGKRVIARAALDTRTLLREVLNQINTLMAVDACTLCLLDEETGKLDYRLLMKNGQEEHQWLNSDQGLLAHLITIQEDRFLSDGTQAYRKKYGLELIGVAAKSWMGVVLRVEGEVIGGLAVESFKQGHTFTAEHWRIFQGVAEQVAGPIQSSRLKEQETRKRNQLAILAQATQALMELAEEKEEWVWHVTFTVATANYGLACNRAILLSCEEGGRCWRGRLGIGHFDATAARHDWECDEAAGLDFDQYLRSLRVGTYKQTPLEEQTPQWVFGVNNTDSVFAEVLHTGKLRIVEEDEAGALLPEPFVEKLGVSTYAILPLRAGSRMLGVAVVDNKHDKEPLFKSTLTYLEQLLNQAVLIHETLRQRQVKDQLIELNALMLDQYQSRPLQETLTKVCEAARAATSAEYVVIYPFKLGDEPLEFDTEHIASTGDGGHRLPNPPGATGLTAHILQSGMLVIGDVVEHQALYDGQPLENLNFIRHERIRALMGSPLLDPTTNRPLGIMYLNYHSSQAFNEQDTRRAEIFARQAAMIIRNAHLVSGVTSERRAREKELDVLRGVLVNALESKGGERERIVKSLLDATCQLLDQANIRVALILRSWERVPPDAPGPREVLHQYRLQHDGTPTRKTVTSVFCGIRGHALATGNSQLARDITADTWGDYLSGERTERTGSELDVPIKLGDQTIGVFNIESPQVGALTFAHQAAIQQLATAAALVLEHARRQALVQNILEAAKVVTTPDTLPRILNSIRDAAQSALPSLSAVAFWYREPETRKIVLGSHAGIMDHQILKLVNLDTGGFVRRVMNAREPIWEADAPNNSHIRGRLIEREDIRSIAVLPLRTDNETSGVICFMYRYHHEFSSEEQSLISLFAEIAAASIRDATRLEATRRQQARLRIAGEVAETVGTELDPDKVLRGILHRLREIFPKTQLCVLSYQKDDLLFTPASEEFYRIDNPEYSISTRVSVKASPSVSVASYLARKSLRSHRVEHEIINDVTTDPRYLPLNSLTRSQICVTLMNGKELIGVLALESPKIQGFNDEDAALIRSIAQQISIAIARANESVRLRFQTTLAAATAWAAEIAHDINREVGYIKRHTYRLRRNESLSEQGNVHVQAIHASAERLAGTLREADPRNPQDLQDIVLDRYIERCVEEMVKNRRPAIHLKWRLACADLVVRVRPDMLKRVMRHLVRNALEAMGGEGTITVETCLVNQFVEIRFADDGPGIAKDVEHSVFQEPKSSKGEGRGFGLMFAKHSIESMGGTIEHIPSAKGAIFAITLTLVSSPEEAPDVAANI